jgi:hypothetical protein
MLRPLPLSLVPERFNLPTKISFAPSVRCALHTSALQTAHVVVAVREPERLWKFAPSVDACSWLAVLHHSPAVDIFIVALQMCFRKISLGDVGLSCLKLLRPHHLHIGKK